VTDSRSEVELYSDGPPLNVGSLLGATAVLLLPGPLRRERASAAITDKRRPTWRTDHLNDQMAALVWHEVQAFMVRTVRNAHAQIFFFQAENDYDLSPSRRLYRWQ